MRQQKSRVKLSVNIVLLTTTSEDIVFSAASLLADIQERGLASGSVKKAAGIFAWSFAAGRSLPC